MKEFKNEFVYICGGKIHEKEIGYLKKYLEKNDINTFIDIDCKTNNKKELLKATDVIFLFNDKLTTNNYFTEMLTLVLLHHKNFLALCVDDVYLDDLYLFLPLAKNIKFRQFDLSNQELLNILFSLNIFKRIYRFKYKQLDKKYSTDYYFVLFLKYLINFKMYKQKDILQVLPIDDLEYNQYYHLLQELLVINQDGNQVMILDETYISEYLPYSYKEVFRKNNKEIDIYQVFNNIFDNNKDVSHKLTKLSYTLFNYQFQEIYNAYRNHTYLSNELLEIFEIIEVARVVNGRIIFNIPLKEVLEVRNYLKKNIYQDPSKLINNHKQIIYLNYVSTSDQRIEYFLSWHQVHHLDLTNDLDQAEIIVSLITNESIYNEMFLNNIRIAIQKQKKTLFIYVDKVELSLKMQYLIKYYHDMCYWAYKRIDIFFEKYEEQLLSLFKGENELPHTNFYNNITKLK